MTNEVRGLFLELNFETRGLGAECGGFKMGPGLIGVLLGDGPRGGLGEARGPSSLEDGTGRKTHCEQCR